MIEPTEEQNAMLIMSLKMYAPPKALRTLSLGDFMAGVERQLDRARSDAYEAWQSEHPVASADLDTKTDA